MNFSTAAWSSVGRKILNALTGLFWVGFVIGHLSGNLLLFVGPEAFNQYAYFLTNFLHGAGVLIAEFAMIVFLLLHAYTGFTVWQHKWGARKQPYEMKANAGGASRKGLASQSMLWTGLLLLIFICFHVMQFKFGVMDPRSPNDLFVNVDVVKIRNLYGLVIDSFAQPIWAFGYIFIMLLLGTHLWHGTWSAFQSLGLANDRYLPILRVLGNILALLLALGFIILPAAIYAGNSHFQQLDQRYVQDHAGQPATDKPAMTVMTEE
jgi:succinate dehydrogenase / fumarate reductase cytochrome b subunit